MIKFLKLILTVLAAAVPVVSQDVLVVWGYECRQNKCVKVPYNGEHKGQGQLVCRMLCGSDIGTLWPKPTGRVKKGSYVVPIDRSKIEFQTPSNVMNEKLWKMVKQRFKAQLDNKVPDLSYVSNMGRSLLVKITVDEVQLNPKEMPKFTYDADESYSLKIRQTYQQVTVEITGKTFFGARHGLETLSQLIVYDDVGEGITIIADTEITDAPAYKHRGVLLDTARNYFSVKAIKRTINGMAMSKLNIFHWHIVDSQSFPLVIKSHPDFHNLGAYSPRKIYTQRDIVDIVEYARVRGVLVIPEFDAPTHVGEGWQNTKMTVCFNEQPWKNFCRAPPCGQLDPTIDSLYDVLEDIYREMFEAFDSDIFHMGGGTISIECWKSSATIRKWMNVKGWGLEDKDFFNLWGYFQSNALARIDKVTQDKKIPIILYKSPLTHSPYLDTYIDRSRYIIQAYQYDYDRRIKDFLERGIRLISTNMDLFIDGETSSWEGEGSLRGWQKFYENRPDQRFGGRNKLILGSEAAAWAEQIDEFTLDALLWPKASALGERLWSNPESGWAKAEPRLLVHRDLLIENRIRAQSLQPEWCLQNQNECPKNAYD